MDLGAELGAVDLGIELGTNNSGAKPTLTYGPSLPFSFPLSFSLPSRHCCRTVHKFSNLAHSDQACAEGRNDELLEAPEAGPNILIENGRVFKDLPALKR